MKKGLVLLFLSLQTSYIFAQNEVKPDGDKLIGLFVFVLVLGIVFLLLNRFGKKKTKAAKQPFLQFKRVHISLKKDRIYFPDNLKLTIKNIGNTDIDLDKPLLVFDNFWLKRKFKINGMENRSFYPLYLEKGKTHTLDIDINLFYFHDKSLKKFPKAKIIAYDIKGKRLGSTSVYLRKTLIKY